MTHEEFAESEKKLLEFIGLSYPYNRPVSQWEGLDEDKLAVVSDQHEPYGNQFVFNELEAKHKDAHAIFSGGDLGDFYSKSRFPKVHPVKFCDELRAVFFRLEWMATHWKKVYLLMGNHDNRAEKKLVNLISSDPDMLIMMRHVGLLERLSSFFDNVELVGLQTPNPEIKLGHLWQYGDIIFTHAERSMAQNSSLMMNISLQLHMRKDIYRLNPYCVIAQAHNHAALKLSKGSETWYQIPTASDPFGVGLEYSHSARMNGAPPSTGYSIFYQSNGQTDINRSNNFLVR